MNGCSPDLRSAPGERALAGSEFRQRVARRRAPGRTRSGGDSGRSGRCPIGKVEKRLALGSRFLVSHDVIAAGFHPRDAGEAASTVQRPVAGGSHHASGTSPSVEGVSFASQSPLVRPGLPPLNRPAVGRYIDVVSLGRSHDALPRPVALGVRDALDLVEAGDRVAHMAGVGQWPFALFGESELVLRQVVLLMFAVSTTQVWWAVPGAAALAAGLALSLSAVRLALRLSSNGRSKARFPDGKAT